MGGSGGYPITAAGRAALVPGFLGLAQVLVEGLLARGRGPRPGAIIGAREVGMLGIAAAGLLALCH